MPTCSSKRSTRSPPRTRKRSCSGSRRWRAAAAIHLSSPATCSPTCATCWSPRRPARSRPPSSSPPPTSARLQQQATTVGAGDPGPHRSTSWPSALTAVREGDDARMAVEIALLKAARPDLDPSDRGASLRRIEKRVRATSWAAGRGPPTDARQLPAPEPQVTPRREPVGSREGPHNGDARSLTPAQTHRGPSRDVENGRVSRPGPQAPMPRVTLEERGDRPRREALATGGGGGSPAPTGPAAGAPSESSESEPAQDFDAQVTTAVSGPQSSISCASPESRAGAGSDLRGRAPGRLRSRRGASDDRLRGRAPPFNKRKAEVPRSREQVWIEALRSGHRPSGCDAAVYVLLDGKGRRAPRPHAPPEAPSARRREEIDEDELMGRLKSEFDAEEVS